MAIPSITSAYRPTLPVVNRANPITSGLIGAWRFDKSITTDLALGQPRATLVGSVSTKGSPYGQAWNCGAGANCFTVTNRSGNFASFNNPGSLIAVVYPQASGLHTVVNYGEVTDSNGRFALGKNASDALNLITDNVNATSTLTVPLNAWNFMGVSQTAQTARTFFLNGTVQTNATNVGSGVASAGIAVGTGFQNSLVVEKFQGLIALVLAWSRPLSTAELYSLYANPWQVFVPVPVRSKVTRIATASGIAFDAVSNSGVQTGTTEITWNHICTGANRFLAVDVSLLSPAATVTTVSYNGVPLTPVPNAQRSTVTGFGRVECWGLANPSSGTNTITVDFSGSISAVGTAVSYTNVHQTSPTEAGNSNQATNTGSATDATVDVTSVADQDWIHAALATDDGAVTANQTNRNNVSGGATNSGADEDFGPQAPGTKTMGWTGLGITATWVVAGYAIRPVTAPSLASVALGFMPVYPDATERTVLVAY